VNASKLAGLENIPAIVLENVSDEDAMIYVIETNLMQRSFSDMTHTEKAAVITLHHSKMFSQGKRNDILEQIKMLENPHEYKENQTCAENPQKLKTRDIVAQEYGLKRETVACYLRINKLTIELKTMPCKYFKRGFFHTDDNRRKYAVCFYTCDHIVKTFAFV